jgi:hypothetical protein
MTASRFVEFRFSYSGQITGNTGFSKSNANVSMVRNGPQNRIERADSKSAVIRCGNSLMRGFSGFEDDMAAD